MREQLSYVVTSVVGLLPALAVSALQPSSAAKLTTILRAVLLPEEAQDYEHLARRRGRPDEEHYWHDYRTGLEEQRRDRGIGQEEARRYEEMSRRDHHMAEEQYWRDYRAAFGHGRQYEARPYEPRRSY